MTKLYTALGLMSGTSMDGIDVSLIKTDGHKLFDLPNMPNRFYAYSDDDRALITQTLKVAPQFNHLTRQDQLDQCTSLITNAHIKAVKAFLKCRRIAADTIDFIGFHGQTVLHQPENRLTMQLGDGHALAKETGIDVVYDFRSHDVAQGGQGAPLVPVFHRALAQTARLQESCAFVNIGGVANLTYINPLNDDLIAFDTGPGNALMDDWTFSHTGQSMDKGGMLAKAGIVHQECLNSYLSHPYFEQSGAKSLDRNDWPLKKINDFTLSLEDGAATLCELTACSIANAATLLPQHPKHWIITGGGTKNDFLMERLAALIDGKVSKAEDFGWHSDFIESQAFGFLAVRHNLNLPQTFQKTTGSKKPLTGGVFAKV